MAPNNFTEVTFTTQRGHLVVTQTKNQAGPIANPATSQTHPSEVDWMQRRTAAKAVRFSRKPLSLHEQTTG
jgi:hypothetical protein